MAAAHDVHMHGLGWQSLALTAIVAGDTTSSLCLL